jgi:multidrug efflux pump subunit AcrA (membrane-fusion protein)
MFGRISFTSIKKDESLIIPRAALMGSTRDAKVFIVENGISKQKKIVVGNVYDDMIEVLQGLNEGEKVVVNGQNNLKNDYRVNVVE